MCADQQYIICWTVGHGLHHCEIQYITAFSLPAWRLVGKQGCTQVGHAVKAYGSANIIFRNGII